VCAALAHRPRLLLADEPTGELDAAGARAVLGLIAELAREHRAAVLLVTHDPLAARIADRTVHVRDGRVSDEDAGGGRTVVVDREAGCGSRRRSWPARGSKAAPARARRPARRPRARARRRGGGCGRPGAGGRRPPHPGRRAGGIPAALDGIAKAHGPRVVLAGVHAAFAPGTATAVTGRSGSGKSTLLRILAGLERPDAGTVRIGARTLDGLDREARAAVRARDVAVVAQGTGLLDHLTAVEQLPGDPARAAAWLGVLGLAERAAQPVGRLSAGERQRVAIARALASGRGLVLLDEPSSRLDEASAAAVGGLLAAAAREHGRTVVYATHDRLLSGQADRVLALDGPRASVAPVVPVVAVLALGVLRGRRATRGARPAPGQADRHGRGVVRLVELAEVVARVGDVHVGEAAAPPRHVDPVLRVVPGIHVGPADARAQRHAAEAPGLRARAEADPARRAVVGAPVVQAAHPAQVAVAVVELRGALHELQARARVRVQPPQLEARGIAELPVHAAARGCRRSRSRRPPRARAAGRRAWPAG
jgi:ABC-type lipoprotein export system ATPase subunit